MRNGAEEVYLQYQTVLSNLSDPVAFLHPLSPQSLALQWLAVRDTAINLEDRLAQRYSLLVLAYACTGLEWLGQPHTHECDWKGVECLEGNVRALVLNEFEMSG